MATRRAAGLGEVNNFLCMPGQTGNDLYPGNAAQPSAALTPAASTGTRFCAAFGIRTQRRPSGVWIRRPFQRL